MSTQPLTNVAAMLAAADRLALDTNTRPVSTTHLFLVLVADDEVRVDIDTLGTFEPGTAQANLLSDANRHDVDAGSGVRDGGTIRLVLRGEATITDAAQRCLGEAAGASSPLAAKLTALGCILEGNAAAGGELRRQGVAPISVIGQISERLSH